MTKPTKEPEVLYIEDGDFKVFYDPVLYDKPFENSIGIVKLSSYQELKAFNESLRDAIIVGQEENARLREALDTIARPERFGMPREIWNDIAREALNKESE